MKLSGFTEINGTSEKVTISIENNLLYILSHDMSFDSIYNSGNKGIELKSSNNSYEFKYEKLSKETINPIKENCIIKIQYSSLDVEIFVKINIFQRKYLKWQNEEYTIQDKSFKVDTTKYVIGAIVGYLISFIV